MTAQPHAQPRPDARNPIRVMVVDDSAVIRGLITRALEADGTVSVIASAGDGQRAIDALRRTDVEIIVLDVEMPRMDGLKALPELLKVAPHVRVIMASTLTQRNADISLRALHEGAVDYVPKPTSTRGVSAGEDFKRELLDKVHAHAAKLRQSGGMRRANTGVDLRTSRIEHGSAAEASNAAKAARTRPIALRPMMAKKPVAIAIGSSTGGPQALFEVLRHLKGLQQPIFLTQHMPPTFTRILAEHIERQTGIKAVETTDRQKVQGGVVHLAPGGKHMLIVRDGADAVVRLDDGPQENFCKPAVDPMMRSLLQVYGGTMLGIILTGMGQDGLKGCQQLVEKGGSVIAQDEASSVVWGMPGAVAQAGVCSAILPVTEIGPRARSIALGGAG